MCLQANDDGFWAALQTLADKCKINLVPRKNPEDMSGQDVTVTRVSASEGAVNMPSMWDLPCIISLPYVYPINPTLQRCLGFKIWLYTDPKAPRCKSKSAPTHRRRVFFLTSTETLRLDHRERHVFRISQLHVVGSIAMYSTPSLHLRYDGEDGSIVERKFPLLR